MHIIIADSPTIEGTYQLNGKLNNFLQTNTDTGLGQKEGGRKDGWMEGIHAHHDIIHYIYILYFTNIILMHSDINECTEDTDDCSHDCYNTVGSYLCDCPTGYELDTDEVNCIGI